MAPELVKVGRLRIEVLSYTNAREWMRKVTAYLKGEDFWTPIETVIEERTAQKTGKAPETAASEAAEATASEVAGTETPDPKTEKSILKHQGLTGKWQKISEKKDWQKANYQAISTLLSIISITDQQAVENLDYAGDIWLYVTRKYTKANYSTLTAAFASYFKWEKNEAHSIEEAAREIEYLANRIQQLNGPDMDIRITKFLFLRGLPEAYESARQTLESQDVSMEEMVLRLTEIEARIRSNASEHAARASEWIKSVNCHKCGKKGHIAKFCKTPKKDWIKNDKSEASGEDDKPSKSDKKAKNKKKSSPRRQRAKAAQEKEIDLDSDDNESAAVAQEGEAAMLGAERPSSWLIDSGATSHCTGDRSIFTSFTPTNEDLDGIGGSPKITGRGDVIITLRNGSTAKLSGVLMVPGIKTNLLSTQALRMQGIVSHQELHGYEFYNKNGTLIARGTHHGKASYLTWVQRMEALYGRPKPEFAYRAAAGKIINAQVLHQRLGHPGKRKLI